MCYHIALKIKRSKHEAHIGAKTIIIPELAEKISGFSHQQHPVITANSVNLPEFMSWGLIPNWVNSQVQATEIRNFTLNAKSETINEKPSFKHLISSNRCLVPVSGFYEWQTRGKKKIPYFIGLAQHEVFFLAGLWDVWQNPTLNKPVSSFTIITTSANDLMAEIHNSKKRMPCIVLPEQQEEWLTMPLTETIKEAVFQAIPSDLMLAKLVDENPSTPTLF